MLSTLAGGKMQLRCPLAQRMPDAALHAATQAVEAVCFPRCAAGPAQLQQHKQHVSRRRTCVMPPASPAATEVLRRASSRLVLPWSTCPMTVTTGGRSIASTS